MYESIVMYRALHQYIMYLALLFAYIPTSTFVLLLRRGADVIPDQRKSPPTTTTESLSRRLSLAPIRSMMLILFPTLFV